jgi:hypothetical protein
MHERLIPEMFRLYEAVPDVRDIRTPKISDLTVTGDAPFR